MSSIDFCFWLQGYFEIHGKAEVTQEQAKIIQNHLNLVFKHEIDPLRDSTTTSQPSVLNALHKGNDPLIRC